MIPNNKFEDVHQGPKAYHEIKHNHSEQPTRLDVKTCRRCHFDTAETSADEYRKNHTGNEKTESRSISGTTKLVNFKKMKVIRGSLDDVIGWSLTWS